MDFPMINENFTGIKNKYGYTQVVDSIASSTSGNYKEFAMVPHKQLLEITLTYQHH